MRKSYNHISVFSPNKKSGLSFIKEKDPNHFVIFSHCGFTLLFGSCLIFITPSGLLKKTGFGLSYFAQDSMPAQIMPIPFATISARFFSCPFGISISTSVDYCCERLLSQKEKILSFTLWFTKYLTSNQTTRRQFRHPETICIL